MKKEYIVKENKNDDNSDDGSILVNFNNNIYNIPINFLFSGFISFYLFSKLNFIDITCKET